jgi:hypothetical protein
MATPISFDYNKEQDRVDKLRSEFVVITQTMYDDMFRALHEQREMIDSLRDKLIAHDTEIQILRDFVKAAFKIQDPVLLQPAQPFVPL